MAQSRVGSTWEINNYGKYINQFPSSTIKAIRQYERINKKICKQKISIMFNEICINEKMLPIYIYIYIYMLIISTYEFKEVNTKRHMQNREITIYRIY